MNKTTYSFRLLGILARGLALSALLATTAKASTINYGNFGPVPPGVTFLSVEESSGTDAVPLYGPPTPFGIGLDFDPKNFVAFASGGLADVTDGQLNFSISAPNVGIVGVSLFEAGDYSLSGTGTSATQALAGAIMRVVVTEINGVKVAPINLLPSNASVGFNLVANPGQVQPWSLGTGVDVASQLGPGQKATKVDVVINNQLLAFSESSSLAFIAKKDFVIDVTVPEPAALLLAIPGLAAVFAVGRRVKRASKKTSC